MCYLIPILGHIVCTGNIPTVKFDFWVNILSISVSFPLFRCNSTALVICIWAHNGIKAIQSSLVKFLWLSTEINIIFSHLHICVHFAVGVLQTPWQAEAKTHLCKRRHKRKMAYKQLRTEIMGQNPESKQAIKNMSMQSMLPDVVCGKWSEGKSTHTLSLCYKQRIMPWLGFTCI